MNSFVLCGLVLATVLCQALGEDTPDPEDAWYGKQEADCLSYGGQCIAHSQCTELVGLEDALCPEQAALGFQCCSRLPKDEKRCRKHGGKCFEKGFCKQRVVYSEARDCAADQDCCILV